MSAGLQALGFALLAASSGTSTNCPSFDDLVDTLIRSHTNGSRGLEGPGRWDPVITRARDAQCFRSRPENSIWATKLVDWASRSTSATVALTLDEGSRAEFAIDVLCGTHATWARSVMEGVLERPPAGPNYSAIDSCVDALSTLDGEGFRSVERFFADPTRMAHLSYDEWLVENPRLQPLFVRALRDAERTRPRYRDALYDDLCVERAPEVVVIREVEAICRELSSDQATQWAMQEGFKTGLRQSLWVVGLLLILLVPGISGSSVALWASWLPAGYMAGRALFLLLPVKGSETEAILSVLLNLVGSSIGGLLLGALVAHASMKEPPRTKRSSVLLALAVLAVSTILVPVFRAAAG